MKDRVFLSILAGPNPLNTRPVLATEDPSVIRAALDSFYLRLFGRDEAEAALIREGLKIRAAELERHEGSNDGRR